MPSFAAWHSIMSLQVYLLSTWEKKQPADHDKAKMAECRILESAAGCRGLQKAEPLPAGGARQLQGHH